MAKKDKAMAMGNKGPLGFVLFMAYIGAVVYFIQRSDGFWGIVGSFFQAAAWPAYVLHAVLKLLQV